MMSGIIVGLIAMLFWTPYMMAKGISSYEGKPGLKEKILCAIPILNMVRSEIKYYGKIKLVTISSIFAIAAITVRFYVWWNFYGNVTAGIISIAVFYVAILLYVLSNIVFVYKVISDADALRGFKLILFSVAFPFGQYFIGSFLSNIVKHNMEQEDTFRG